jgi:hypothetical protein
MTDQPDPGNAGGGKNHDIDKPPSKQGGFLFMLLKRYDSNYSFC